MGEWFHHPGLESESVIPNEVIGHCLVIIMKWYRLRHCSSVLIYSIMKGTVTPCSSIRRTTLDSNIHTEELVLSICHCHHYNAMEALVLLVVRASIGWLLHGVVFAIHSPQTAVVVPSGAKLGSNFLPLFFSFGAAQHFVFVDRNDGFTHLEYELADGTCLNPEAVVASFILLVEFSE